MKNFKRKAQVLAVAAALGVGAAGSAQAGVIAQSVLSIFGLTFNNPDSSVVSVGQFSALIFNDSSDITATLNGVSSNSSINSSVFGIMDLPHTFVGAGAGFGQNNYTHNIAQTLNVARGDTLLAGSPLAGTPVPVGAVARSLAEAQVSPDASGSTQSNIGLIATFQFALAASQTVGINFTGLLHLIASLTPDMAIGSNAQASSAWTFEISDGAGTVFEWTPNGQAGGIVGGTEVSDPCDLTQTAAAQLPGQTSVRDCTGAFSAVTGLLTAGTFYTLNIRHDTTADARAIPEPSVLALLGLGLFGVVAGLRRSRKQTA